jgi:PTH2 family peptidyl-tRNA hydrolase
MRQVIIARKDLNMSPGKLAAQVSHASLAFLTSQMRRLGADKVYYEGEVVARMPKCFVTPEVWDEWICGIFTKTVCEARNYNQLMKAVSIAQELGLSEGTDYFLIKDACLTELEPEEVDENGVGRVLTCIGFAPLPDEIAHLISKKFQLYK